MSHYDKDTFDAMEIILFIKGVQQISELYTDFTFRRL